MMKIWEILCSFFGFSKKEKSPQEEFEELESWINSKKYFDECNQKAFQAVQKKDSLKNGQIHPHEGQIIIDCVKVDSALSRYKNKILTDKFGEAKYLTELLNTGISTQLAEANSTGVANTLSSEVARKSPSTELLKERLNDAEHEMHIFKGANGISREAEEPARSSIMYYMGAFAIGEIIANMLFIREVFEPIYGLFLAMLTTVLNLGGAAWFGYQFREKNHYEPERSKRGQKNAIYAAIIIIFANAVIAGFRIVAQQEVNSSFWLETILLFVVGSAFGYAAFQKAYRLDDPYPGYGPLSRRVNELRKEIMRISEEHAKFCLDIKNKALTSHSSLQQRIDSSFNQLITKLPEIQREVDIWARQRKGLEQRCKALQQVFKAVVITNSPSGLDYPSKDSNLPDDQVLTSISNELLAIENSRSALEKRVTELVEQINTSRTSLDKWFKTKEASELFGWPK